MQTTDDILFSAHGPDPIPTATTEVVGTPGNALNVYWIVSHFPIGSVVSGPFPQKGSPNVLDDENYVHISWLPTLGALSYDLLFTRRLELPKQPGNFALALNLTETEFRDEGQSLSEYDLAGIRYGAPQQEWIFFDNRDRKQPTLRFIPWPIEVSSIIFEDGSSLSTAGAAGGAAPPNQSIQFNNNGAFAGSPNLIWDNVDLRIGLGTQNPVQPLHIVNPNGLGYIRLESFSPNLRTLYSGLEFYTSGNYVAEIGAWVHNDLNDGLSIDVGAFISNLFISHVTGYVGINTGLGIPQAQLDVIGQTPPDQGDLLNTAFEVQQTGRVPNPLQFGSPATLLLRNTLYGVPQEAIISAGSDGNLFLQVRDNNSNPRKFRLNPGDGTIQIGTNPAYQHQDSQGLFVSTPVSSPSLNANDPFVACFGGAFVELAVFCDASVNLQSRYGNPFDTQAPLPLCLNPLGGNVGIGTQNPQTALDVIVSASGGYAAHFSGIFDSATQGIWLLTAGPRAFISGGQYGNSHKMQIDAVPLLLCPPDGSGGMVGVGFASNIDPKYRLDVRQEINITGSVAPATAGGNFGFLSFSNDIIAASDQRLVAIFANTETTDISSAVLSFWTANAGVLDERMRIDSQGRVDITGSLFINGVQVLP